MKVNRSVRTNAVALLAVSALGACASGDDDGPRTSRVGIDEPGGFSFGLGRDKDEQPNQANIGVNSFLWRATLDTLSFMPLESADPFGGVIITEWYVNPEKPNEKFKATVYILDARLRADGIKVSIFKQTLTANGWVNAATDTDTGIQIENAILTRARQLRLSTLEKG